MRIKSDPLRLLLDANLPRSTQRVLRRLRMNVTDVRDVLRAEAGDREVFKLARRENRVLVTRDLGFSNILLYPPKTHPGIIIIRTRPMKPSQLNRVLELFLKNIPRKSIRHCLIILEQHRFRIRK